MGERDKGSYNRKIIGSFTIITANVRVVGQLSSERERSTEAQPEMEK